MHGQPLAHSSICLESNKTLQTCCRESGHVRVFKLASAAADDYAYMLPPDYSKLVRTMPFAP